MEGPPPRTPANKRQAAGVVQPAWRAGALPARGGEDCPSAFSAWQFLRSELEEGGAGGMYHSGIRQPCQGS